MRCWKLPAVAGLVLLITLAGPACRPSGPPDGPVEGETYTIERTDYHPPKSDPSDVLKDDTLASKNPEFDPELVDRRPLEGWRVNLSGSVLRLDVPMVRPDSEPILLTLYPSYRAAAAAAHTPGERPILPSVNMIDGKAKQFDDGLYAALDQAYYRGLDQTLLGHVTLIKRLYEKLGSPSVASPYLAAGLELAGVKVETASDGDKENRLRAFRANETLSKPISFYTWNRTLSDCFRFLRYFQQPLGPHDRPIAAAMAKTLGEDKKLLADYRRAVTFYAKLTNPPETLSLADLVAPSDPKVQSAAVSVFPSSTSREAELFRKLFPQGLPPDADLMRTLIGRIRAGAVDLKPKPDSGWYDYQVYALETLLLPERGEENAKLLLTKSYKKRMLEAFKALITKRRETHTRQFPAPTAAAMPPPPSVMVAPRLRAEPCPTYYLRTARAYAFLATFLDSTLGENALASLHGLREGAEQKENLRDELASQRALFYGLYLLSAEDIGLKPTFLDGENVDRAACEKRASEWLAKAFDDPDLARDTRVSIPIFYQPGRNVTRLWVTLGVRLTRLNASYARPPKIKPAEGPGDWKDVDMGKLLDTDYLIPVDEFAEVELHGARALNREELRALCNQYKTREAIIGALQK